MDKFASILITELSKHQAEIFIKIVEKLEEKYKNRLQEKQELIKQMYIELYKKYKQIKELKNE